MSSDNLIGKLEAAGPSLASETDAFLSAAVYGAFQQPCNGISQVLNHCNVKVGTLHLVDAPAQNDKFAAAGHFVGSAVEFWLGNLAVGKLTGIGRLTATSSAKLEALKMGLTGSLIEAANPINGEDHFGQRKAAAVVEAMGSFATFGAVNGKASELGLMGRSGFRSYLSDSFVYGLSGTASGMVGSELHAVFNHGRAASLTELRNTTAQNIAMGVALASLEHLVPGKRIKLSPAEGGAATSKLSTEEWVSRHYDGKTEIRSPLLTWIAENKQELRPPRYDELRAQAFGEHRALDLSLGDWAPQQRLSVIKEVRRLSDPILAEDGNIDAFISRFTTPKMQSLAAEFGRAHEPLEQAKAKVLEELAQHPELSQTPLGNIRYDKKTRAQITKAGNGNVLQMVDELGSLEFKNHVSPEVQSMHKAFQTEFDALTGEIGLPPVKVVPYKGLDALCSDGKIYIGMGDKPAMSANTVDRALHEFNHHLQGLLYSKETLAYLAKYPFYVASNLLGLRDNIPMMQYTKSRSEFINTYVGSEIEKQAYATQLLARIRSTAAGLASEPTWYWTSQHLGR